MQDTPLTKLRRKRARVTMVLQRLEPLLAGYQAKLADIEAAIQALAPELNLPPRRYAANPYFARGELPRLMLDILRQAGEPLATREVVRRALATKGIVADAKAWKSTRRRVQQAFVTMGNRGLVRKVGSGREGKRGLVGK